MRITLNGYVVPSSDQWLYDWFKIEAFSAKKVRDALRDLPDGEALELEINSCGGDVFSGFEIYSLLRSSGVHTVAEVQSIAASAASTVMVACDEVRLSPVAQVMIHLPSCSASGNQNDLRDTAAVLDSLTTSIVNAYELKCGASCSRSELMQLISAETWMCAQDAVKYGFADSIIGDEDGVLSTGYANAIAGGLRGYANGPKLPDIGLLLKEYERRVRDGAAPAEGHDITVPTADNAAEILRRTQRLNLEKIRYS